MDPVNTLLCLAAVAWSGQTALGWLQIQRFNRELATLSRRGHVRIGRSAGRFTPRVVLALSLDQDNKITGNFIMKGLTVFSRPVTEMKLHGLRLEEIKPEILFPKNKSIQQALTLAMAN